MNSKKAEYAHLVSLTKLFLLNQLSYLPKKKTAKRENLAVNNQVLASFSPPPSSIEKDPLPAIADAPRIKPEIISQQILPTKKTNPSLPPSLPPSKVEGIISTPSGSLSSSISAFDPRPFYALFQQNFPHIVLKPLSNLSKKPKAFGPVVVFSFGEKEAEFKLLEKLSKAINEKLQPAQLLSIETLSSPANWQTFVLRVKPILILANQTSLKAHSFLSTGLTALNQENFLHNIPLLLLADLSLYMSQPTLKKNLWSTLCHTLNKHNHLIK